MITSFISRTARVATLTLASLVLSAGYALADEYSFVVHNRTDTRITKILVSEKRNGEWGYFDIGRGIGAGKKVTLVWDSSTDSESCRQWVKAVYANGDETEPARFNFCEEGLEIEFED